MDVASTMKICIISQYVTPDFAVFEAIYFHSVQEQTKGFDFTEALLCSLRKCNFKLSSFFVYTDNMPFVIGFRNNAMPPLYKHMH
jgi:hypothetical protein